MPPLVRFPRRRYQRTLDLVCEELVGWAERYRQQYDASLSIAEMNHLDDRIAYIDWAAHEVSRVARYFDSVPRK